MLQNLIGAEPPVGIEVLVALLIFYRNSALLRGLPL